MTSATTEQGVLDRIPGQLLVAGNWCDADDGRTFAVVDPATGDALRSVADAGAADAVAALDGAAACQAAWGRTPSQERSDILRRAFDLVTARADELALLITMEMGKPLAESRGEVAYAAGFLRWFSEEAVRIRGDYRASPNGLGRLLVMRGPVGPCLLITPWNFPIAMAARKVAPAIAAGCTVICKPAPQTPLSMLALAAILEEAGLPPGVLSVLPSSRAAEVGSTLIGDPRLRKLSFTGSTAVGRQLAARAATNLLRVSLELGGNAPFLVLEDAVVEAAVDGALIAKLRNMGEACTAANRFIVVERHADRFAALLADRMRGLTMGRGTEPGVDLGPLIDAAQRGRVAALVDDAVSRGARVLCGGHAAGDPLGSFYEATVLVDVPPESRLLGEEIFGPVAPVVTVGSDEEAIAVANATPYGLAAYVYTRDIGVALRTAERLETGMVGLNQGMVSNAAAPFGGVKQSGLGREGGFEGIDEYLDIRYVAVNI